MTKTLEVAPETKILIRARELIEQGWIQGAAHRVKSDPDCELAGLPMLHHFYCAAGAIDEASWDSSAREAAYGLLSRAIGRPTSHITGWNDAPGRQKAEVLAAFDTAASLSMGIPRLR